MIRAGGGGLRVSGFGLPAAAGSNFRGDINKLQKIWQSRQIWHSKVTRIWFCSWERTKEVEAGCEEEDVALLRT